MDQERRTAAAWFRTLRDRIVAAFEGLEDRGPGSVAPGRFEVMPTARADDGGADDGGDEQITRRPSANTSGSHDHRPP